MSSFFNDPVVLTILMSLMCLYLVLHPWTRKAEKHKKCLERTAVLEHDLNFLPHTDPDVKEACKLVHLPRVPKGPAPGAKTVVKTPNELRLERTYLGSTLYTYAKAKEIAGDQSFSPATQ